MTSWAEMTIGHRIRIAAQIRQMTIQEIAKKAKVPRSTIYHIVDGSHTPLLDNILAIGTALGVRLGWLFEGEEPIFRQPETQKAAGASSPPPFRVPTLPLSPTKAPSTRRKPKRG